MAEYVRPTLYLDMMVLVTLIGFIALSRCLKLRNMQEKLLFTLSVSILLLTVDDVFIYGLYNTSYSFSRAVVMGARIMQLVVTLLVVVEWILFVDYMLNGSVEYLKRQYKKVFVPMGIAVLVILINPFTEILFSLNPDLSFINHWPIMVLTLVELTYFLMPVYLIHRHEKEGKNTGLVHIYSLLVPVLVGEIANAILPLHITPLEFTFALIFLYCSMTDVWRFEDEKSAFHNRQYLTYLEELMQEGKQDFHGVMLFSATKNAPALSKILEEEKPDAGEMLRLDDNRFLLCVENMDTQAQRILTRMLSGAVADHNDAHPEDTVSYTMESIVRGKDEETRAWIQRIGKLAAGNKEMQATV